MKINKIKPYVIYKVNSNTEFIEIQNMLFNKNYNWLSYKNCDQEVIKIQSLQNIKIPFYISNLTFTDNDKFNNIELDRKSKNDFNNNCLFISQTIEGFDLKLLRKDKILNLNLYD